jgi:hypothetical protein
MTIYNPMGLLSLKATTCSGGTILSASQLKTSIELNMLGGFREDLMSEKILCITKFIKVQIKSEKRGNPCGFPHAYTSILLTPFLTLGKLEAGASGFLTVLLTFFNA